MSYDPMLLDAHLTDDDLDEMLIGCASPEMAAHVDQCAACAGHLAEFRSSLASFNQAASAWSEAKSNALTRDLQRHRAPFRITARAAWSCASVVVLAVMAAVGLGLHERSAQIAAAQAERRWGQIETASNEANSEREMANDDAMLRQIDSAISSTEPSPEELYGARSSTSASHQNLRRTQVKD